MIFLGPNGTKIGFALVVHEQLPAKTTLFPLFVFSPLSKIQELEFGGGRRTLRPDALRSPKFSREGKGYPMQG